MAVAAWLVVASFGCIWIGADRRWCMGDLEMTQAPERIWAYNDRQNGYRFTAKGPQPHFEGVEYVRADLASDAAPVRVKPLVWEDFDGLGAKASAYYQANYLIQWWKGQGQFEVALSFPGYQTGYDGERWHPTLEAAKAAAQQDYSARILAALEPDAGVVAELVKIIGHLLCYMDDADKKDFASVKLSPAARAVLARVGVPT